MKKSIVGAIMAALFVLGVPVTAFAATQAKPANDVSTGSPAYLRCRAAGGTDHFCGELGGYWYFN